MKLLYLLFFVSFSCNQDNKKSHEVLLIEKTDSLPIKIKYEDLKKKCSSYATLFRENKSFTIDEYIDIIRADNTINLNRLRERDSVFLNFDNFFFKILQNKIINIFHPSVSKGMGYYIKEYDIDIGGVPNKNSFFKLEE